MLLGVTGTVFSDVDLVSRALKDIYSAEWLNASEVGGWDRLLQLSTENFQKDYIVKGIETIEVLESLSKRPFFVHVAVDCTLARRIENWKLANYPENNVSEIPMNRILEVFDYNDYSKENSLVSINERSLIKVVLHTTIGYTEIRDRLRSELSTVIDSNSLTAPLRPSWDTYFMKLANLAASRANCMKRKVGCVIVRDCRVIATGYNGTPRYMKNCNQGGCPRCNGGDHSLHTCLCLHAEENALLEAGRDRVGKNAILYCDTCPCLTCSVKIVQTGIKEVVYSESYRMDEQSLKVLKDGKVSVRRHKLVDERTTIHIGRVSNQISGCE